VWATYPRSASSGYHAEAYQYQMQVASVKSNNVCQHAAVVKRVATDMQHHMLSLNTIVCIVTICENVKKSYTFGLLFIVTEAQISLLLETSDSPFSFPANQHILHSVVCGIC